jgi:hypothetical protein
MVRPFHALFDLLDAAYGDLASRVGVESTWLLVDSMAARSGRAKVAAPAHDDLLCHRPPGEVSAPAKEDECFHWALSLDVDAAMRLKLKVLVNV